MENLTTLQDSTYQQIKITFNSDGKIMTKKELKPLIKKITMSKLRTAAKFAKGKELDEVNEMIDLLIND